MKSVPVVDRPVCCFCRKPDRKAKYVCRDLGACADHVLLLYRYVHLDPFMED